MLVLEGKTFADDSLVLALGALRTEEKKLLGGRPGHDRERDDRCRVV